MGQILLGFFAGIAGVVVALVAAGSGHALDESTLPGEPEASQFRSGVALPPGCDVAVRPGVRVCHETGQ